MSNLTSANINATKEFILKEMKELSLYNFNYYTELFNNITDKQFVQMIERQEIRLYDKFIDGNLTYDILMKYTKKRKIKTEYILNLPHVYENSKGQCPKSSSPVMVLKIPVRRTQQKILTENDVAISSQKRDVMNQGTDGGKINGPEMSVLASVGLNSTITELITVRSSHHIAKGKAYRAIEERGEFNLAETDYKNPLGKRPLQILDGLYAGMCLVTDINRIPKEYI